MLPILMYHGLHADPHAPGRYDPVYSVRPDDFARQLDWLLAHGYQSVRLGEHAGDATRQVVITFDDGDISNLTVALPLLRERGLTAEFFISSDFLGQPGMLAPADVGTLSAAGMGVGSHGRSHAFLADLDEADLIAELLESRRRLQVLSRQGVVALALPGGRGGARERWLALALGYRHLLGSTPGPNRRAANGNWWERLAVTRSLSLPEFGALVGWQGLSPRIARARFLALAVPKRVLGNDSYQRLRARLL
ncbi:polysaccharide deacetylase family protein [Lysobacter sp. CW239]|jgi:peptidoglycan/xylan/chitin deacetylase (PgdA/CDA1 family)|uniref:polysaccharide deacetylase family protein n=1 Tax=Lysobacteraceae TaxID=32033 RepID=UPI00068F56F3|nr:MULTISPECIES: polysaccharide deacetylase family protein [Lysobacter]QOD92034.1 polysaccharide deacetylase family protein [Lysobacter sp. CW239]